MNLPSIEPTALPGVLLITPRRFQDGRGHFCETYNAGALAHLGLDTVFVQDNASLSREAGTVRGLHYQAPPRAQAKLVRCGRGRLWDVAVDFRRDSDTYGHWIGVELTPDNGRQLYIPAGFLHGFVTLEPETECLYKCSDHYAPEQDGAVAWDSLGIDWPLGDRTPVLSDKDAAAPAFDSVESPFTRENT